MGLFGKKELKKKEGKVVDEDAIWKYLTEYEHLKKEELSELTYEKIEFEKDKRVGIWSDSKYNILVKKNGKVLYKGREFDNGNICLSKVEEE